MQSRRCSRTSVWPGGRSRSARRGTARGRTSRSSPSTRSASSCACSTTTTARRGIELTERTAFNWHGYLPGVGPGQRYGFRVHGPYDPSAGTASTRRSCCSTPTRRRSTAPSLGRRATCCPYVPGGDDDADLTLDETTRAAIPKSRRDRPGVRLGGRHGGSRRRGTRPSSTSCTCKGFTKLHPGVREDLRGTYAGLASDEAIALPQARSASPRSSCCRCTTSSTRASCTSAGSRTTGATRRSASSPRTPRYAATGRTASRCASSRGWSRRSTAPASR